MDIKLYDSAFVEKIGAVPTAGKGYFVDVGLQDRSSGVLSVPVLFDLPEEWWDGEEYGVDLNPGGSEERVTLGINVKRVDIVPDPSRFLPNFKGRELSETEDNTWNVQAQQSQPVTILYSVQMVSESQHHMNALLKHTLLKLPMTGFGTTLTVSGRRMPFRVMSVRNKSPDMTKSQRKFMHEYTYAVEAWITSTECQKIKQILSIDIEFFDEGDFSETVTVS